MPDIAKIIEEKMFAVKPAPGVPLPTTLLTTSKPVEDPPMDPPPIDFDLERYKDKLRRDLETVHKTSPTLKIPPSDYKLYLTYIARTIVQNALDRNMQLHPERHAMYCDDVNETLHMMYPLLEPALDVIEEAVANAKVASEGGMAEASVEEKTLAFERAIVKQFHDLLAVEFRYTEIDGRNINKELVADCNAKLLRRVEFRKKKGTVKSAMPDETETVVTEMEVTGAVVAGGEV